MSRKDFELIARAIANGVDKIDPANAMANRAIAIVAMNLADALATTNARFNRGRFLEACKVQ